MSPVNLVMVSFALVAGITFLVGYILLQRFPSIGQERLRPGARDPEVSSSILRWEADLNPGWQRMAARLGRALGPGDRTRRAQYRRRLVWAGFSDPRAVTIFMGVKAGVGILGALAYPVYG